MAGIPLGAVLCIHLEFLTNNIKCGIYVMLRLFPNIYKVHWNTLLPKCYSETDGTLDLDFEALPQKTKAGDYKKDGQCGMKTYAL